MIKVSRGDTVVYELNEKVENNVYEFCVWLVVAAIVQVLFF